MNAKLLSAVIVGLVVVASVSPAIQAIELSELKQVLNDEFTSRLRAECKIRVDNLPSELIEPAFAKIFRVYYDDPSMLQVAQNNQKAYIHTLEHPEDKDYAKDLQSHSEAICDALESFFDRIAEESVVLSQRQQDRNRVLGRAMAKRI